MIHAVEPRTATIYQFPLKARRTAPAMTEGRVAQPVVTDGWYHEAAVQEAVDEATRRRTR
ncbi:DUF2735 domain-containing protein [Azospirillum sp. RWY-5-1]|uniref:DUF2735 domain-containing protein n=1 Tax=Azospirillum oleiclasticum TaxID=2735135 RepID=A0ABX2T4C7_9PROT|nr:DUF2735 domain-containing protein [Azospirillum oleiclasticum]NYZ11861.1 DUF2735 domain-containing protein [Azospirillum oleiclasticum]NYZ19021.1 DUF2735 domain-containing protein [Azospirillum oleiclasticum]